jgi:hypothetical protein
MAKMELGLPVRLINGPRTRGRIAYIYPDVGTFTVQWNDSGHMTCYPFCYRYVVAEDGTDVIYAGEPDVKSNAEEDDILETPKSYFMVIDEEGNPMAQPDDGLSFDTLEEALDFCMSGDGPNYGELTWVAEVKPVARINWQKPIIQKL